MSQPASLDHPVHALIAERSSPRSFLDQLVPEIDLLSLFEAARWASSCFNEQPWRFVVARASEPEAHAKLGAFLVDGNAWALKAPVLIVVLAKTTFAFNGAENRHAWHDTGLAVGNLATQATALGLSLHQMAGIHVDAISEGLGLPEDVVPVSMIALGYRGPAEALPEPLAARERAPRVRRPQSEFVFNGRFGAE